MLAHADIHRSLGVLSIDFRKKVTRRAQRADAYKLAEREFQAQYDFAGSVGSTAVESTFAIPFDLSFVADPGNQRSSSLDRPLYKPGVEMTLAPPGTISYLHLAEWVRDDDFNFIGAVLTMGVYCPAAADPTTVPASLTFKGILHAAFQGFASVWDPEGPLDAGGNIDNAGAL